MSDVYLLQNQDKLFLGKQKDWLDERDRNSLFKTHHKDEAVNSRVEVSAREHAQRVALLLGPDDVCGLPDISDDDLHPLHAGSDRERSQSQALVHQRLSRVEE